MSSSSDSLPPGWEGNVVSSPESIPPGWESTSSRSPETLPPGWENQTSLQSPSQENPADSLPSPSVPALQEDQVRPFLPPYTPSPSPPQETQSHLRASPPAPLKEIPGSLPPGPMPLSQERERSSTTHPAQSQKNLDALPNSDSQTPQENLSALHPPPLQPIQEMGQMVCGSCHELLSYPRSSKYIKCACCQTINFVLEAHQVGNVNCGKCLVLLMYPFGAKSVRCSSCHSVTEIGTHNIRPPVSLLQGISARPENAVN